MTDQTVNRATPTIGRRGPMPTPLVAVVTVVLVAFAAELIIGGGNREPVVAEPVVAGQETDTAAARGTDTRSEVDIVLTEITSERSPNSEMMARTGTYRGRYYVVSGTPGTFPTEGVDNPPADTLYMFDGQEWTDSPLASDEAGFLLPEEIAEIQAGGPYDVGFLGKNYGSETSFGAETFRIREPSLQSQRAELTSLVAEDADGQRSEQRLVEMVEGSGVDAEGFIMERVVGGDVGLVVTATEEEVESPRNLLLYSPDGENWAVFETGEMDTLGVIMGTDSFIVMGSYGDDRVYSEPSPVFFGHEAS